MRVIDKDGNSITLSQTNPVSLAQGLNRAMTDIFRSDLNITGTVFVYLEPHEEAGLIRCFRGVRANQDSDPENDPHAMKEALLMVVDEINRNPGNSQGRFIPIIGTKTIFRVDRSVKRTDKLYGWNYIPRAATINISEGERIDFTL